MLHWVKAINSQMTVARLQQGSEHFNSGRFTSAIRPKKGEDFTLIDIKAHIVDGNKVAKALTKLIDFNNIGHSAILNLPYRHDTR